ncbi:hypothetical protein [Azospirillum soli]|uniref:hypothetical protein n=1 Tax=Azospirillum soli TaxID=1304799 RepID=UPI001AE77001|nr:hypothetical protein [Azospirillum soli]MBP2311493.1 hypothetical protein [Azospirillum soli]
MAKQPKHHGQPWTDQQVDQLRDLAKGNTPTRVMGLKLGRTPEAVQSKATQEGISLKPVNQRPYGTKPR